MSEQEQELSLQLLRAIDEIGFEHEQTKCLAISLLLSLAEGKSFKELYTYLKLAKHSFNADSITHLH